MQQHPFAERSPCSRVQEWWMCPPCQMLSCTMPCILHFVSISPYILLLLLLLCTFNITISTVITAPQYNHVLLWLQIPVLEVQQCTHPHPCSTDKDGRPTCCSNRLHCVTMGAVPSIAIFWLPLLCPFCKDHGSAVVAFLAVHILEASNPLFSASQWAWFCYQR